MLLPFNLGLHVLQSRFEPFGRYLDPRSVGLFFLVILRAD